MVGLTGIRHGTTKSKRVGGPLRVLTFQTLHLVAIITIKDLLQPYMSFRGRRLPDHLEDSLVASSASRSTHRLRLSFALFNVVVLLLALRSHGSLDSDSRRCDAHFSNYSWSMPFGSLLGFAGAAFYSLFSMFLADFSFVSNTNSSRSVRRCLSINLNRNL